MKTVSILAIAFLVSAPLLARTGRGCCNSGGWGANGRYSRMYNPATEQTLTGEVVSVNYQVPMKGMSKGLHVILDVEGTKYDVHVGPQWFLDKQDTGLAVGDKISVTGSYTSIMQKEALIAKQLVKGGKVLVLREDTGRPIWAGWRGRGQWREGRR